MGESRGALWMLVGDEKQRRRGSISHVGSPLHLDILGESCIDSVHLG